MALPSLLWYYLVLQLPALVVLDAVARLLPGVLGAAESAEQESFSDGLLDWPHYTRPVEWEGRKVPDVLQGGNHAHIRRWRLKQSIGRTWLRRPDLLQALGSGRALSAEDDALLQEYLAEREVQKNG